MQLPSWLLSVLAKFGVNTTKLQWRLYQWEKRQTRFRKHGMQWPLAFRWLSFPHKRCPECRAVNERGASTCISCGRKLPSIWRYRAQRFADTLFPESSAPMTLIFLSLIIFNFALGVLFTGPRGIFIMRGESALRALDALGAFYPVRATQPSEWWRILGFALAHGGLVHIAFNGLGLWNLGPLVEGYIGRLRMLVVITVTQLGAAFATYVWYVLILGNPRPTVGASGVLFGLIGYGWMLFRSAGTPEQAYSRQLMQWAFGGVIMAFLIPGINNAGHAGGFLAGAVLALVPLYHPWHNKLLQAAWVAAFYVSLLLWSATLGFMGYSVLTYGDRFS